jgi:hypothetical protein
MNYLMVFLSWDNDIYFTYPMGSIVPLGTLSFINLKYRDDKAFDIDMSIECFRYQYDIDNDTLELHFKEQKDSEMSETCWEYLDELVHSIDYDSNRLIITTSTALAYIKH